MFMLRGPHMREYNTQDVLAVKQTPNVLCYTRTHDHGFDWNFDLLFGGFNPKNRGQKTGSRYISWLFDVVRDQKFSVTQWDDPSVFRVGAWKVRYLDESYAEEGGSFGTVASLGVQGKGWTVTGWTWGGLKFSKRWNLIEDDMFGATNLIFVGIVWGEQM